MGLLAKVNSKFHSISIIDKLRNQKLKRKLIKKNVIFVMNLMKFILELNLLNTPNGFSDAKNAGILFQKKINILMERTESHN